MRDKNKISYKNYLKQNESDEADQDVRSNQDHTRVRPTVNWAAWRERRFKETIMNNFKNKRFRKHHRIQFIDQDGSDILFSLVDDDGRTHTFVKVRDSSTSKYHLLRVPNDMERVKQAVAWTFGISEEEYSQVDVHA